MTRVLRSILVATITGLACASLQRMEPAVNKFTSELWVQQPSTSTFKDDYISAVFVLKRTDEQKKRLEEALMSVSTPTSSAYGEYFSLSELKDEFAVPSANVDLVTSYLLSRNISSFRVSQFNDMIFVRMAITEAENTLSTRFGSFRHAKNSHINIHRVTEPYYLPTEIAKVVSYVDDILRFPSVRDSVLQSLDSQGSRTQDEESPLSDDPFQSCGTKCAYSTTPDVLQTRYGYPTLTSSHKSNSMSVAEFQFEYYDQLDLDHFADACGPTVSVDDFLGTNKEDFCIDHHGCVEALLDIEYIGAVAYPIPLTVYYQTAYSLLVWIENILALDTPPLVHSVSYGNDEVDQISEEYMDQCNTQFQLAGTRGLSILFASGDQGVWGRNGVGKTFHPDFPSSSPYITSVGGTNFKTSSNIGDETTWNCGGGGFSDYFPQPEWQSSQVNDYFDAAAKQNVLPSSSLYNSTGRGYPDISALGGNWNPYCVTVHGGTGFMEVAGTSASTPVVAGIIAQLNNVRLSNNKPSLGWLNPWLYSSAKDCFNDVDDLSVNYCYKGAQGFAATKGWDPATGFGTPIYSCLESVAKKQ